MIYFDSTFLVKLQLKESGQSQLLELVREKNEVLATSILARMEVISVFHRNYREGQTTHEEMLRSQDQFFREIEVGRVVCLPLSLEVIEQVEVTYSRLPKNTFLRTGDAIHLATAAEAGFKEVYSNDRHLLAAASLFKLKGINPLAK